MIARRSRPRSRRSPRTSPLQSVRWWLARSGARRLALAGGLFANVRLNRLLAESLPLDEVFIFPAMGDDGLPVGAALALLHARDGTADLAAAPPPARQRLSRQELRRRDRRHAARRRDAAARRPAGRDRGRPDPRRQGGRDLYRPHGVRPARARRPLDHREPARPRDQRQPEQAARPLRIHAVRALSCWRRTRAACSRSPT